MQQENQPGAIDALDGMRRVRPEDVERGPAERRRLGAPVAEEAAGVGDDLLPTGGADARRASNHTELRDALDPIGEQWIGAVVFSFGQAKMPELPKKPFWRF